MYRELVASVDEFAPGLLLISAGFDAHERDPLASMRVTTEGYAAVVGHVMTAIGGKCPLALVTEGGYDLGALAASLDASIAVVDRARDAPRPVIHSAPRPR